MLPAHQLFRNGHLLTLDQTRPMAEALAVRDGRIVAVGTNDELAGLIGPGTQVIDLDGYTVIPGFHDAHCHILLFGLSLVEVNARAATTIAEVVGAVAA
ncbi:MAG TPA: amidohydrolase, partial [Chloroflexi bacterium]|nr:amidohydrolase [Chloroflexota bacterium]